MSLRDDLPDRELAMPGPRRIKRVNWRGQALLWLGGCFLLLGLGLGSGAAWNGYKHYRLENFGAVATGRVVAKRHYTTSSKNGTSHHYEVTFYYTPPGSDGLRGCENFVYADWQRLSIGDPVSVCYDRERPDRHTVSGQASSPLTTAVILGVTALVFGGVGAILGAVQIVNWSRDAALVINGAVAVATIENLVSRRVGKNSIYEMFLIFNDGLRRERRETVKIEEEDYKAFAVAEKLSVLFDRNAPRRIAVYRITSFRAF